MQDQKEWARGQAKPKSRQKLCPGSTPRLLQILHPTPHPVYLLNNLLTLCLNPTGSYPPSVPPAPPSTLSFLHPGPVKRGRSSMQAEIMKKWKTPANKTYRGVGKHQLRARREEDRRAAQYSYPRVPERPAVPSLRLPITSGSACEPLLLLSSTPVFELARAILTLSVILPPLLSECWGSGHTSHLILPSMLERLPGLTQPPRYSANL